MSSKKELLDIVDFLIATGDGLVEAHADDGKITVTDSAKFMPALVLLPAAVSGFSEIPSEFKNFSEADIAEIKTHILEKVPGIGEKYTLLISAAFKIASAAFDIIHALKATPKL